MSNDLISIIIPTFNRLKVLPETLESIAKQSYKDFECLIIDDGSTDATETIVANLSAKDPRFKYYLRPAEKPKGANTCRNIGLEIANGKYIMFFDSDDLMTPNQLKIKLKGLLQGDYDFVVTKTKYFNNDDLNVPLEKNYQFDTSDISVVNYITHKVNWLTYDTLIKTDMAKAVRFNEALSSGQEYNYYCKLMLLTSKVSFIPEVLTLRRYQKNSIRGKLLENTYAKNLGYFKVYWTTYQDIKRKAPKKALKFLMFRCFRLAQKIRTNDVEDFYLFKNTLIKIYGVKGLYYLAIVYLNQLKVKRA